MEIRNLWWPWKANDNNKCAITTTKTKTQPLKRKTQRQKEKHNHKKKKTTKKKKKNTTTCSHLSNKADSNDWGGWTIVICFLCLYSHNPPIDRVHFSENIVFLPSFLLLSHDILWCPPFKVSRFILTMNVYFKWLRMCLVLFTPKVST